MPQSVDELLEYSRKVIHESRRLREGLKTDLAQSTEAIARAKQAMASLKDQAMPSLKEAQGRNRTFRGRSI